MESQETTVRMVETATHQDGVPLAIVACLAAAFWAPPALAQTITDLGTFVPAAINASGQIAGSSTTAGGATHAFLYSKGVMTDLGTLGGSTSQATGINDSGQVVGLSLTGSGLQRAFQYSGGVMTDLGTLPGGTESGAEAINDSGQVVGWSHVVGGRCPYADGCAQAFLYSGGVMSLIDAPPGYGCNEAAGINNSGQVAGLLCTGDDMGWGAFLYSGGMMTDLGTLGGPWGQATGISSSGQVVGYSLTADSETHAFLYSAGVMTDLGTLGGSSQGNGVPCPLGMSYGAGSSQAYGINASGQVVGSACSYAPVTPQALNNNKAFLYSGGSMIDLNSILPANSGWVLEQANAINDSGQIVGFGTIDGQTHGFLLNLTALSPSSAAAGGAAFTLTVTGIGTDFVPGATVNWNGTALATTYVSATEVTASVPASLIAVAGTASVTVTVNEITSAGATFSIHLPRGLPQAPERPRNPGQRAEQ